jgi:transcription antitermination factor NusG
MLKNEGFPAIAPTVMHWTGGAAQPKKTARRLMPGYVFFDSDTEPAWNRILKDSAVLKLLSYGDGEYALRGTDLEFIDWIKKNNGIIEMSSAVKVGSMIEFVAGPLKDMNGKIIKINRSRRQVQVSFGSENGIISKVWCSMEFVCSNADSYSSVKENKKEFDSSNP